MPERRGSSKKSTEILTGYIGEKRDSYYDYEKMVILWS